MHRVQTSYAMYFNRRNQKTGYVFQGRFKSKRIDSFKYLGLLSCYIHYNPVDGRLVDRAENWKFSSAGAYLLDIEDQLADREILSLENYKKIYEEYVEFRLDRTKLIQHLTQEL